MAELPGGKFVPCLRRAPLKAQGLQGAGLSKSGRRLSMFRIPPTTHQRMPASRRIIPCS